MAVQVRLTCDDFFYCSICTDKRNSQLMFADEWRLFCVLINCRVCVTRDK